jgi:hypothetical protein
MQQMPHQPKHHKPMMVLKMPRLLKKVSDIRI